MTSPDTPPVRFEQAIAELERVLRDLEDGTTTLDEALAKYERGVALVRACSAQLQAAEQKIRLLAGLTDDGTPDLKPFDHTSAAERAKPKRTNGKPPADDSPF